MKSQSLSSQVKMKNLPRNKTGWRLITYSMSIMKMLTVDESLSIDTKVESSSPPAKSCISGSKS